MSTVASSSTGASSNRNNRYSALRSLVQENDTEIEDELARCTPCSLLLANLNRIWCENETS